MCACRALLALCRMLSLSPPCAAAPAPRRRSWTGDGISCDDVDECSTNSAALPRLLLQRLLQQFVHALGLAHTGAGCLTLLAGMRESMCSGAYKEAAGCQDHDFTHLPCPALQTEAAQRSV